MLKGQVHIEQNNEEKRRSGTAGGAHRQGQEISGRGGGRKKGGRRKGGRRLGKKEEGATKESFKTCGSEERKG
jgi:hypothetical protein